MMKRILILMVLATSFTLQAQWVDDPQNNTFLVNCSSDAGEVYLSTNELNGDTYLQFMQMRSNGWVPTLQRISFDGTPLWGNEGVTITGQSFSTWSQGVAMVATSDGAVVSCFANEAGQNIAVRIDADGSYAWGEQGVVLFEGVGGSRTELLAGEDGGVWALGCDYDNTYLCYLDANGIQNPTITISDAGGKQCMFGLMVPGLYNTVFVVYEKESWAYTYYYEKELWVAGFSPEGGQIAPEEQLMSAQIIGGSYCHYVVPDGLGGGYAYLWHPAIGNAFNTYIFHFDEYGHSTISEMNGIPVHSADPANYYLDANATVDPVSHDLIIAYQVKDAYTQAQDHIYMNRITSTGEKVWGEGILVADYTGVNYAEIKVDTFEDGNGFSLIYKEDELVRAKGYGMDGNLLWTKQMSTTSYNKSFCENSTGFHLGQNIVAWVNSSSGNVYGQNIGPDGTMGPIEPIIPEPDCFPPTDFEGAYVYDDETQEYGVMLAWVAPETQPLHYNLYRYDQSVKDNIVIEVPAETTSYYDEAFMGDYKYQLTAVYEECESEFALTPYGEDHVCVIVTGIDENEGQEMVTVLNVYNVTGQQLGIKDLNELGSGIYILHGLTQDGRMTNRKIVVNRK